jgi:hypothetical protein
VFDKQQKNLDRPQLKVGGGWWLMMTKVAGNNN